MENQSIADSASAAKELNSHAEKLMMLVSYFKI